MTSHRTPTCRPFSRGLIFLGMLVLAASCGYGLARAGGSGSEARLRELMTQRYELLQVVVKNMHILAENGRIDVLTQQNLTTALYRAEADLCPTQAERVKVYEKLVDALAAQEGLLERMGLAGRANEVQVAQGKLATLNARIDLERLRLGQPIPQP